MSEELIEKEETARCASRPYAIALRKVIPASPDELVTLGLNVYGPRGHKVELIVEGLSGVAVVAVSPNRVEAPYTASMAIRVLSDAKPGFYPFDIRVRDETEGVMLGAEHATLLVLKKGTSRELANHYISAKQMFAEFGSNGLLWYILRYVYPSGAGFKQLKEFYEFIVGRAVSGGTVSNILARMIKKGVISRVETGEGVVYKLLIEDFTVVRSRIDTSRIRTRDQLTGDRHARGDIGIPYAVKLAYKRALKIADKHGVLPALLFLAHTLCGARETGYLLLWRGDMFITCEAKTGFCHVFHSLLISQYFEELGAQPGVMSFQIPLYREAWKTARRYVRKYYKSFAIARRLHYLLKEKGFIWYDDHEIINLGIYYYDDETIGVVARDNEGKEILWEENTKPKQPVRIEWKTAFPYEHVYPANEETYFLRPGRIL